MQDEWELIKRYTSMPPVRISDLIEAFGIRYRERAMPSDQSGYFAKKNGEYEIGVNASESPSRKRFTAAHELGHFVLHRDMLREGEHFDRLFGAGARDNPAWPFTRQHEIQANRFAADVLMPSREIGRRWSLNKDLKDIAQRFGVSEMAAEIRLKNLGLIQ